MDYQTARSNIYADTTLAAADLPTRLMLVNKPDPVNGLKPVTEMSRGKLLKRITLASDRLAQGVDANGANLPANKSKVWIKRLDDLRSSDPVVTIDAELMALFAELVTDNILKQTELDAITNTAKTPWEKWFGDGAVATADDIERCK